MQGLSDLQSLPFFLLAVLPKLHAAYTESTPCDCLYHQQIPHLPCVHEQWRHQAQNGTHHWHPQRAFHCDEALGCFLLKRTKLLKDAEVVRSRDPAVLKDCNVVIDVGGVYDPSEWPCIAAAISATQACMTRSLFTLGPTNSGTGAVDCGLCTWCLCCV